MCFKLMNTFEIIIFYRSSFLLCIFFNFYVHQTWCKVRGKYIFIYVLSRKRMQSAEGWKLSDSCKLIVLFYWFSSNNFGIIILLNKESILERKFWKHLDKLSQKQLKSSSLLSFKKRFLQDSIQRTYMVFGLVTFFQWHSLLLRFLVGIFFENKLDLNWCK